MWSCEENLHYIGMMGCKGKNDIVHDLVLSKVALKKRVGAHQTPHWFEVWCKTPAELAIAIVAELVDERYKQNYSEAAHTKHDSNLGR